MTFLTLFNGLCNVFNESYNTLVPCDVFNDFYQSLGWLEEIGLQKVTPMHMTSLWALGIMDLRGERRQVQ